MVVGVEERHCRMDLFERKNVGLVAIIEVSGVVTDLVSEIDKLRLERRTAIKQILLKVRRVLWHVFTRVLDDSFANFKRQIQAAESCIAQLEIFNNAQGMQIVVKRVALSAHGDIKRLFASVTEWRMSDVVYQSKRLHQVDVQAEHTGNSAGDLRHFDGMRETIAKMVGVAARE